MSLSWKTSTSRLTYIHSYSSVRRSRNKNLFYAFVLIFLFCFVANANDIHSIGINPISSTGKESTLIEARRRNRKKKKKHINHFHPTTKYCSFNLNWTTEKKEKETHNKRNTFLVTWKKFTYFRRFSLFGYFVFNGQLSHTFDGVIFAGTFVSSAVLHFWNEMHLVWCTKKKKRCNF